MLKKKDKTNEMAFTLSDHARMLAGANNDIGHRDSGLEPGWSWSREDCK